MNKLKQALAKKAEELNDDEKAVIAKNWDILNDDLRAKFADLEPEAEEDEDEEDGEDEGKDGIDAKTLKSLINKAARNMVSEKAEAMAKTLVDSFTEKMESARAKFMKDGEADANKNKDNDETTRKFFRALMSSDVKTLKELGQRTNKAMTTADDDDSSAGFTIPEVLATEVLRLPSVGYGIARQEFGYNLLTQGNSKRVTALGSTLSVYWVDEGEQKPSSTPSFSVVTLLLKKLAVIVPMTEEVVEDSAVDLTGLVAQLIREAVDMEVDLQFFNGDGTVWTGLLNDTSIPSDVLAATKYAGDIRPEDIIGLEDNTPLSVNGKYYMHRTVLTKVRTLRQNADGTGDYLFNPLGGGDFGTLNGRPVVLVEAMPSLTDADVADAPIMLYGDLKRGVAYGEKSDIKLKLLDQATITDVDGETVINLAEQDMIALRAVQRVGMKVTLASAMNRLVSGPAA